MTLSLFKTDQRRAHNGFVLNLLGYSSQDIVLQNPAIISSAPLDVQMTSPAREV